MCPTHFAMGRWEQCVTDHETVHFRSVVPGGRLNMLEMLFISDTEQRYKVSGFYLV